MENIDCMSRFESRKSLQASLYAESLWTVTFVPALQWLAGN